MASDQRETIWSNYVAATDMNSHRLTIGSCSNDVDGKDNENVTSK